MSGAPRSRFVRVVAGEIETRTVTTRLVIPTTSHPAWPPFLRVSETTASRGRQLPSHAHEHEEVLTYVTEGFASYQLEHGTPESLPQGSARFLTAPARVLHNVSPAEGGAIRWFNLVVSLPHTADGVQRVQTIAPSYPSMVVDNVQVRPLVGAQAPMRSLGGLECQALTFTEESTTIPRVGLDRRAVLYALAGRGWVDEQMVVGGQAAFVEGYPGVTVRGINGFRAIFATVPREAEAPGRAPGAA